MQVLKIWASNDFLSKRKLFWAFWWWQIVDQKLRLLKVFVKIKVELFVFNQKTFSKSLGKPFWWGKNEYWLDHQIGQVDCLFTYWFDLIEMFIKIFSKIRDKNLI